MEQVFVNIGWVILIIYILALIYILGFSFMQFHLLYYYKKNISRLPELQKTLRVTSDVPFVTIQLPVFNERYVIERLIDCMAGLDYPQDRFEIQILDDSTDDTTALAERKAEHYRKAGFRIEVVRRPDRKGYKAGALQYGMKTAKGEFIAIFDADFLPEKDFLQKTIPHFADSEVGIVQTRWEHINEDYSVITRLQAFQLNVHFTVEQNGRYFGDLPLQFNGTAGVWRRKTIEDAGGWKADTLTEDLDLSYRAQLKNWKIKYLEHVGSPAELPIEMNGFKAQQYRWMKGGAETAKKILPTVWRSTLSLRKKLHATTHLLSSAIFVVVFLVGVFSVPMLFVLNYFPTPKHFLFYFLVSLIIVVFVYYVGNVETSWKHESKLRSVLKFLVLFPVFLALSMGMSFHNTIAVLQGYFGKRTPFVRTPKFDIKSIKDTVRAKKYLPTKINKTAIIEALLALYFLFGFAAGIYIRDLSFIFFHLMLAIGYATISFFTFKHYAATR